jgi:hypothetical protein
MARSLTGVLLGGMKRGGGVMGAGCGVEVGAAHPRRGEAGVALDGGARPVMVAAPCFSAGGGRKVGWAAWAERPDGPVGRWFDWAESEGKILFRIKIGFLNIKRLWKFVGGDLGGILVWGFFLNSSRLLKDFRKV